MSRNGLPCAALLLAAASLPAAAASGQSPGRATAWTQCIWEKVPTSASNWTALPRLKRGARYGEDSAGFQLRQRLVAACWDAVKAMGTPAPALGEDWELQRALLATRPARIGPDQIDPFAFRCEKFFEDDPAMARLAGVDWGFGQDLSGHQLKSNRQVFGNPLGAADIAALSGSGRKAEQAIRRVADLKPVEVRTYAEVDPSGKAYVLAANAGLKRCKFIQADGSLIDA